MTKLKLIGLFVAGLLVGVTVAGLRFKHFMAQSMLSDEAKMAFGAAEEANLLALLRLNETNRAIQHLETSIDGTVLALAKWDKFKKPDEATRKSRDRLLVSVKVYRDIYPPTGEGSDQIRSLLAKVPGRSLQSACKSGICRLDDLHRTGLEANTNSLFK